jgi:pimeloyl-ACP methyl ester carboxylesterase
MKVTVNGRRVHISECGEGPEVLLLHGNPDSSALWRPVMQSLSSKYRCLAPDLPGFGRSEVVEAFDGSLEAMAAWTDEVLSAAGIDGAVSLAAHDFGGIFGLAWAISNPRRVRRIAAGGFPFFPDYQWHFWGRVWRTPVIGELSMRCFNRWLLSREMRRGGPRLPQSHISETFALLSPAMKKTVLKLYRATDPCKFADWQEGLRELVAQVPTMILWGKRDPFVDAAYAHRFGAHVTHVFPESGHWFPVEESEDVARLLADFFEPGSDASGGTALSRLRESQRKPRATHSGRTARNGQPTRRSAE